MAAINPDEINAGRDGCYPAFALPFQGMIHTPLLIYLGAAGERELWAALLLQAAWVLILGVLVRLLWARALRAAEMHGG